MTATLATDEFLALDYLNLRLTQFKKLAVTVKKLILDIVRFYLQTCYPFDDEAISISTAIKESQSAEDLNICYKRFLEFLPIALRSRIQGKFLYREPTGTELAQGAKFYHNDPNTIKKFLQNLDEPNENGFSFEERREVMEFLLSREGFALDLS